MAATASLSKICVRLGLALSLSQAAVASVGADEASPPSQQLPDPTGDKVATQDGSGTERSPPETYMGRVIAPPMHFSGASWLIRASRNEEERPDKLLKALELKPGQVVCDFGCGNGFYTLELARRVGPTGAVYAVDVQPEMLELLAERARPRGLGNIKTVLATADDPGLPANRFDMVVMIDVYHELSHPADVLKTVRASLKPKGRLVDVEFRQEDPAVPIRPLHKMSQAQVMNEIPRNSFKLVGQYDDLPWQHVLFFARDDSPLGSVQLRPWKHQGMAHADDSPQNQPE